MGDVNRVIGRILAVAAMAIVLFVMEVVTKEVFEKGREVVCLYIHLYYRSVSQPMIIIV